MRMMMTMGVGWRREKKEKEGEGGKEKAFVCLSVLFRVSHCT